MKSIAKSLVGKASGIIILLMIIIALTIILNQSNVANAQTGITGYGIFDQVFAGTFINLTLKENFVRATLTTLNGTLIENEQIDFYLDDSLLGSGLTNSEGLVEFPISENGTIKAVFNGNPYLGRSEAKIGEIAETEVEEKTKQEKAEEIISEKIEELKPVENEKDRLNKWYEKFNVSYENSVIFVDTPNTKINLTFFINVSGEIKKMKDYIIPAMVLQNILSKVSNNSYKFGVNITNIPSQVTGFGIEINSSYPNSWIEQSYYSFIIKAGNVSTTIDFSDIKQLNPVISENSVYIPIVNNSLYFDPTINFTTDSARAIAITPLDTNKLIVAWCDNGATTVYFRAYDTNGTNISNDVTVKAVGACSRTQVSVTAFNTTRFSILP